MVTAMNAAAIATTASSTANAPSFESAPSPAPALASATAPAHAHAVAREAWPVGLKPASQTHLHIRGASAPCAAIGRAPIIAEVPQITRAADGDEECCRERHPVRRESLRALRPARLFHTEIRE